MEIMRIAGLLFPALALLAAGLATRSEAEARTELHGAGWVQSGRVKETYADENAVNNYLGNWMGNSGGLVSATTTVDEHWEAGVGLGTVLVHLPRGVKSQANIWYPFWVSFVDEARLTYSAQAPGAGSLRLDIGAFSYKYAPDARNLGLYLLNGYVYPGTLVSGFKNALGGLGRNVTGAMGSYRAGGFRNDLILNAESEDKPLFDISVADIASYRFSAGLEVGAGVNFYRLLPQNREATSPGKGCNDSKLGIEAKKGQENPCFIIRRNPDGSVRDTVTGSLAGTKAMARFRMDPKAWFGSNGPFGPPDWVLYGEAAVIGFKDYPVYYTDILRRIPVMLGLNLPGFGFLEWGVEAEYYASKNSADNLGAQQGSWLPSLLNDEVGPARDDWKWSLMASRKLSPNLALAGMIANDHLRFGGTHNNATGIEAMRRPRDWYWNGQIAFFF